MTYENSVCVPFEGGEKQKMSVNSRKRTYNKKDLKDIIVMMAFTAVGAALVFLVETVIPNFDFGNAAPYIVPLLPLMTYAVNKFIKGK